MAKVTLDVGPAANQTVVVAIAAVNNIGVTIQDRGGPVALRAGLTVDNAGAGANTLTTSLRKNGVIIAVTTKTVILVAATRQNVSLEHVDLSATVGDVYAIEANVAAVVVPTLLIANQCHLLVEALSQDAALVAGIGPATA
jgi:hypothetical protein